MRESDNTSGGEFAIMMVSRFFKDRPRSNRDIPMSLRLEYHKNYAYLFFILVAVVLLFGFAFEESSAGVVMFLAFYFLGFLQLRSGVALDQSWTARYTKTKNPKRFRASIVLSFAAGTLGLALLWCEAQGILPIRY